MTLNLVTVQMRVERDVQANLSRILRGIERAATDGADFVLFPEAALSGYYGGFDQPAIEAGLAQVSAACRDRGVAALVGTCYREGQAVYNQVRVFSDDGMYLGAHSKTIPTRGDLEWCVAGGGVQVFEHKGLTFGALICNDFWCTPPSALPDTHLVQQLAEAGARVVFHAINSGFNLGYLKWHTAHLEMYADIYNIHVLTSNAAGDEPTNAPSGLLTPQGDWAAQADPTGEQYLLCSIEVDEATP